MSATLDHLVVAARTLEEGAAFVLERLGVAVQPGGRHERMGTHNLLLNLGGGVYLEVIAIDPNGITPSRPRWFGLDSLVLESDPKLMHWVARTDQIDALITASLEPLGVVHPMSRAAFEWRISIPDDGHLPGDGLIPTLIQWDVPTHPTAVLEDRGCKLEGLSGTHPNPERIRAALASLGLEGALELHEGLEPTLTARIRTPGGLRTL